MLSQCSFKVSHVKQTSILELWPFGVNDLVRLLAIQPVGSASFVAVKHHRWRDGFHPPLAKLLTAKVVSQGLIARSSSTSALVAALGKREVDAVVDLKLFFPKKQVSSKPDVALLENHFESFDEAAALKVWGGCWITVHDACKTYITLPPRPGLLRSFFRAVLEMNGARLEKKESASLAKRLWSLPDSQCLFLAWFRDVMRYRVESADLHNYEKLDELVSWKTRTESLDCPAKR
jgi:hypothetical protein